MRFIIYTLCALVIMFLVWAIGLPKSLGAHPWWADKVIFIGAPVGIVIAFGAMLIRGGMWLRLCVFAILTVLAYWVAKSGGEAFAASYADDAAAGKQWYFGWIATMTGLAAFLTTLAEVAASKIAKKKADL
ncbi:hypothetical protein [Aliiroseovarius sp. 2305UL8-7]|uniref:hypothetical protein n=1 Tax=Aliiroseovarius conchicola TaxID=3121637 RepID=UPI003527369B